ncbi:MAG: prepilin-type N-terminal cleavage/methylation domain-containing protein [Candidatus Niyogibacteria bacterium]|nr:prepilin-type N-terminal cleavage/methylation domain-containing protein [Candidatus Niyogibacteria bacterium]
MNRGFIQHYNVEIFRRLKRIRHCSAGFTLLEMAVTVGVAAMISSLILANFPQFSRRLEMSRTAQAVALSFREAEAAALGVREFTFSGVGFFPAYGLHFEKPSAINGDGRQFFLFADLDEDRLYDGTKDDNFDGEPDERADIFTISGAPKIVDLCSGRKSRSSSAGCRLDSLDITFVRPNPDVKIKRNNDPLSDFSDAEIVVRIPTGECRRITIWSTGQLSIEPIEIPCQLE